MDSSESKKNKKESKNTEEYSKSKENKNKIKETHLMNNRINECIIQPSSSFEPANTLDINVANSISKI